MLFQEASNSFPASISMIGPQYLEVKHLTHLSGKYVCWGELQPYWWISILIGEAKDIYRQ
jgi:hypothetical protein